MIQAGHGVCGMRMTRLPMIGERHDITENIGNCETHKNLN